MPFAPVPDSACSPCLQGSHLRFASPAPVPGNASHASCAPQQPSLGSPPLEGDAAEVRSPDRTAQASCGHGRAAGQHGLPRAAGLGIQTHAASAAGSGEEAMLSAVPREPPQTPQGWLDCCVGRSWAHQQT